MSKYIGPSLRLALLYLAFSIAWILLSDEFVGKIAGTDPERVEELQHWKGIAFVTLSSFLLYFTSKKFYTTINNALQKKEALLQKLTALNIATREGIIDYDIKNDTALVNDQMKEFLGLDLHQITGFREQHLWHMHPSDRNRVDQLYTDLISKGLTNWQVEYRYLAADKTYRDIISRGYIIRDRKTGEAQHMILALQDVTDLRDANSKYYEQQMIFRQSITKSIIEAEEKERNRWAEEIHDNIGQVLTVTLLYLDQLHEEHPENIYVQKSRSMLDKAIRDIRQISSQLKPPEFDSTTLFDAITDLANNVKRFNHLEFNIDIEEGAEAALNRDHKIMIYRIAQEQFNNIIKYAAAQHVTVAVSINQPQVSVRILDDGVGFDPASVKSGIGLKNIRSRLQVFSGQLFIKSEPGQGCELVAGFILV